MSKRRGLTFRQQLFVREYLIDLNATKAAIRAGYALKSAEDVGPRLVRKSRVSRAIREGFQQRAARTRITADRVMRELALVAFADIGAYEVDDKGRLRVRRFADQGARRAVASFKRRTKTRMIGTGDNQTELVEVETEVRLWDKVGALGLMCQHLGMLKAEGPDPIDDLIAKLPPEVAEPLRGMLREYSAGRSPAVHR